MNKLSATFNRLSLDHKVVTLIAIEIVVFCVITWVAYSQVKTVGNEVRYNAYITSPLFESIKNIEASIDRLRFGTELLLSGGTSSLSSEVIQDNLDRSTLTFSQDFNLLLAQVDIFKNLISDSENRRSGQVNILALHSENLLKRLEQTSIAAQQYHKTLQAIFNAIKVRQNPESIDLQILRQSDSALVTSLDAFFDEFEKLKKASSKHSVYVERIAIGFIILSSIAAFIFFITMLLLIIRKNISKPLQLLTDTINAFTALHKVDESEFEKVLMQRGDELGRLSRSFNRLKYDLWSQGQDLNDAKNDAEKANRAKTDFLAAASHDLRQPLHAMQMYIAALRQKTDDEETNRIIEDIDAVSVSTARLLSALLDVSQLEAGAVKPQLEDFAVQDVLRRVYRSFAPAAKQKGLDFKLISSSAPVNSDPVLLERILGNFVSNAVRYTQEGRVLIGCRRRHGYISVEVWDTGCGIPEQETRTIFEDFHQIDNRERDRSKGLGLGLGIAQRLSVCLGHEIECDSIVGRGSRFAVLVNNADKPVKMESETLQQLDNQPWDLSSVCVLLIEDDKEVLKATQQLLVSWGCKVYLGSQLDDALRIIEEPDITIPNIIIADNRLPGGATGTEVSTKVQLILGQAIPTLIITGDVAEDNIREIADQGYRVLTKPVQPAKLRALISHLTNPSV